MTFEAVVKATPDIWTLFHAGLKGIKGEHRRKLAKKSGCSWRGSINLDEGLATRYPQKSRWDYVVGFRSGNRHDHAAYVEVHHASTREVQEVLKKQTWLLEWLADRAPALSKMPRAGFFWVSTDGVHIQRGSRQYRLLAQSGIMVASRAVIG